MLKLNLGAGTWPIEGYVNIDRHSNFPGVEPGEAYPLRHAPESVDAIRASHILEHFSENEVPSVLQDWARALKMGGTLAIAVPDFDQLKAMPEKWDRMLMGGQTSADDFHKSVFTERKLTQLMHAAGFDHIERWTSELDKDCAAYDISLNLRGTKVRAQEALDIKIGAIMSLPRLGFNAARGSIENALRPFGIPLEGFTSAFWHQSMQDGIEQAIENGTDWILTFDYDTMVTPKMLDRMFHIFGQNPHMDALAALQPKRGDGSPLMTVRDAAGKPVGGEFKLTEPIKAHSAHFGCTLFRAESFKDVPKPWLVPIPGPDGSWGKGHVDADIEFWNRWAKAGKTLFVDPFVRIGHLEIVVLGFDAHGAAQHSHVNEWVEANR